MFLFNKAGTISFQMKQVRYAGGKRNWLLSMEINRSLKVNVWNSVIRGQVGKK
jgi:hypothetical protein